MGLEVRWFVSSALASVAVDLGVTQTLIPLRDDLFSLQKRRYCFAYSGERKQAHGARGTREPSRRA